MVNILKYGVDGTVITEWRMVRSVEVSVVVIQFHFRLFRINTVEERMLAVLINELGRDNLSLILALLLLLLPQLFLQLIIFYHYVN